MASEATENYLFDDPQVVIRVALTALSDSLLPLLNLGKVLSSE